MIEVKDKTTTEYQKVSIKFKVRAELAREFPAPFVEGNEIRYDYFDGDLEQEVIYVMGSNSWGVIIHDFRKLMADIIKELDHTITTEVGVYKLDDKFINVIPKNVRITHWMHTDPKNIRARFEYKRANPKESVSFQKTNFQCSSITSQRWFAPAATLMIAVINAWEFQLQAWVYGYAEDDDVPPSRRFRNFVADKSFDRFDKLYNCAFDRTEDLLESRNLDSINEHNWITLRTKESKHIIQYFTTPEFMSYGMHGWNFSLPYEMNDFSKAVSEKDYVPVRFPSRLGLVGTEVIHGAVAEVSECVDDN